MIRTSHSPALEGVRSAAGPRALALGASHGPSADYVELKRIAKQRGLFKPQPVYYTFKFALTAVLLAIAVALLFIIHPFWLQLVNAAFWGFVFTQTSTLGHDIGHREVFHGRRWIQTSTMALGVLTGLSLSWWTDRHNRHHAHPNQFDLDPDVDTPFFSFHQDNARTLRRPQRFVVEHQVWFFVLAQPLLAVVFRIWSVHYLLTGRARHPRVEGLFTALHYPLYFALLLSRLSISQTIVFVIVHQACFGTYAASVIAPNHKGMPTLEKDTPMDFLRQSVLTARNVRAHPCIDFWYAGLNYQIEHHLFPSIPRNNLTELQEIVRAFCASRCIPYYETSMLQSYREILQSLAEVSASVRNESSPLLSPP
jgi:fatty acid desaturase